MTGFYYDGVLDKGPLNTHIWRQTDCISLTEHYKNGTPFLEPEMHIQLGDANTSGKTAGEFPILYYGVGKLWSVFGESFLIYRIVWLLLLFFGSFAFYCAAKRLINDQIWALALTGLLLCSPTFIVYGVSFLTDVPAICFIFIGLYFIVRYHQDEKILFFWFAILFFTLAGLVKISSLIAVIFLGFILLIETFGVKTLTNKTVFRKNWKEWMGFIIIVVTIVAWYLYASLYNNIHNFKYTFNAIYPIWEPEKGGIPVLWERIQQYSSFLFLNRSLWWFLFLGFLIVLFFKRQVPLLAWLSVIFITLGCSIYVSLWGPLLGVHDYYYNALIILIPGIFLPLIGFIQKRFPFAFKSIWLKSLLGIFFIFNFIYCLHVTRIKFNTKKTDFNIIGNDALISELNWINWDVNSNLYRFYKIRHFIKEIGVKDSDKLIIFPDNSFNITLVLTGHEGWTNFQKYNDSNQIRDLIRKKAKYLLLGNEGLKKEHFLQPFLTECIGVYDNHLFIYKLNTNQ
jgi:hypothetical protein